MTAASRQMPRQQSPSRYHSATGEAADTLYPGHKRLSISIQSIPTSCAASQAVAAASSSRSRASSRSSMSGSTKSATLWPDQISGRMSRRSAAMKAHFQCQRHNTNFVSMVLDLKIELSDA